MCERDLYLYYLDIRRDYIEFFYICQGGKVKFTGHYFSLLHSCPSDFDTECVFFDLNLDDVELGFQVYLIWRELYLADTLVY